MTCTLVHLLPPSLEVNTSIGVGELPCLCAALLRKSFAHRYTRPKNGLDWALSAQICSLSKKDVCPCLLLRITGGFQEFLSATEAAVGLSSRETASPTKPLNTGLGNENSTCVLNAVVRFP